MPSISPVHSPRRGGVGRVRLSLSCSNALYINEFGHGTGTDRRIKEWRPGMLSRQQVGRVNLPVLKVNQLIFTLEQSSQRAEREAIH